MEMRMVSLSKPRCPGIGVVEDCIVSHGIRVPVDLHLEEPLIRIAEVDRDNLSGVEIIPIKVRPPMAWDL